MLYNQSIEIPEKLKKLYKHWQFHTIKPSPINNIDVDKEILARITPFITERMKMWEKKQLGQTQLYTTDPILSKYRFCNIYRELDRQTIEIHTALKHLESNFDLWLLNILFSRMVCNPATIKRVGFLGFNKSANESVYKNLQNLPSPKYGVAYIFPVSLLSKVDMFTREEFFCFYLPEVMQQCATVIRQFKKASVIEILEKLLPIFGLNFKFHWTEVLIDVAYQFPDYINLFREFPIGPGALPTMKRLNPDIDPVQINKSLIAMYLSEFPYLTLNGKPIWLSAENWEGIGCEFRKYSNLQLGEGRKRLYRPKP